MSEKKLRGTFDMSVHGGKADTDLNKWPGKNEPPDDYKKSSSDYPAHGKYVDKGGYIPENEIPDPNGKNPLELLLEKRQKS